MPGPFPQGEDMPRGGARPNSGGSRPGAGRPTKEPMKSITIRLPERIYEQLTVEAQKEGKTVSAIVAERLLQLLGDLKKSL